MAKLPLSAKKYFWDVNFDELDPSKRSRFVIERLLEYGDFPELKWLFAEFNEKQIVDTLKYSRRLSKRRASGWANYFGVPRQEVTCLNKVYPSQPAAIWPY